MRRDPEIAALIRNEASRLSDLERLKPEDPALQALVGRIYTRRLDRLLRLEALLRGTAPSPDSGPAPAPPSPAPRVQAPAPQATASPRIEVDPPVHSPVPQRPASQTPGPVPRAAATATGLEPTQARLMAARALTPSVRELTFAAGRSLSWQPGQYIKLQADVRGGTLSRSYSIARCEPAAGRFTLWVKRVVNGPMSTHLAALPVGSVLRFTGPTGSFTLEPPGRATRRVVFIGTGTGLAPLYAQLEALLAIPSYTGQIELLWGLRGQEDIFYAAELDGIQQRQPRFGVAIALSETGPGSPAFRGRVTDLLMRLPAEWLDGAVFYLAGNGAMINDVITLLRAAGVAPRDIHTEAFFSK